MKLAITLQLHYGSFTEDMLRAMCDIAPAIAPVASLKEIGMSEANLDSVVRAAASELEQETIDEARRRTEAEISDECWNRNDRLNMIAYEDRR